MLRKVVKISYSLDSSKKLLIKTFCGFLVLKHTVWQKHKSLELEINKKLFTAENVWVTNAITRKLLRSIKTKYFNKIRTMHMHYANTRK